MAIKEEIQSLVAGIIKEEKTEWDVSHVRITDKVGFNMKEMIRQFRKNYWGIFDTPNDSVTGRPKVWEHLTKVFVDFVVKNTDVDMKEMQFKARNPSPGAKKMAALTRSIMYNSLDEVAFDDDLDIAIRQKAIDGTIVWANHDELKPRLVNLLNWGIDPTAFSIAETPAVHEYLFPTQAEFKKMGKNWLNMKDVEGDKQPTPNDPNAQHNDTEKRVKLIKRVGLLPKFCMTGKKSDMDIDVPTCVYASESNGGFKIHEIKLRKDNKLKGYEEAWHIRVFGRWYGEGVPERLMWKQIQENTNINIRQTKALVSQLGIFLVRQGSGLKPGQLSKLAANGALVVSNIETDIKQMPMNDSDRGSYDWSASNYEWAQKLSGAFEASTGESLPGSTTATVGVIQNNASQQGFNLIKEGFTNFLKRWIKNYGWPIASKDLKVGDVVRIAGDEEFVTELDQMQVNTAIWEQIDQINQANELAAQIGQPQQFVDPMQVQMEMQRAHEQLKALGGTQFITLLQNPNVFETDVEILGSTDRLDLGIKAQNLIQMLPAAPEYRAQIVSELFDVLGIGPFKAAAPQMTPPGTGAPGAATPVQSSPEMSTQANTFEGFGKAQAGATGGY